MNSIATLGKDFHAEVSVASQPIRIEVDSPTDWLAAVVTPVIIGLAAAYIAWLNQRNSIRSAETLQKVQLRGSIANFRQTWATDFRTHGADFISATTRLYYKNFDSPGFAHTAAANDLLAEMSTARASLRMMLDKDKPYTKELTELMNNIEDVFFDDPAQDPQAVLPHLRAFVDKAQEVREVAWRDIKRDLNGAEAL